MPYPSEIIDTNIHDAEGILLLATSGSQFGDVLRNENLYSFRYTGVKVIIRHINPYFFVQIF